jgi:hypothetical protein
MSWSIVRGLPSNGIRGISLMALNAMRSGQAAAEGRAPYPYVNRFTPGNAHAYTALRSAAIAS